MSTHLKMLSQLLSNSYSICLPSGTFFNAGTSKLRPDYHGTSDYTYHLIDNSRDKASRGSDKREILKCRDTLANNHIVEHDHSCRTPDSNVISREELSVGCSSTRSVVASYPIIAARPHGIYCTLYMCAIGLLLPNGPETRSAAIGRTSDTCGRSVLHPHICIGDRLTPWKVLHPSSHPSTYGTSQELRCSLVCTQAFKQGYRSSVSNRRLFCVAICSCVNRFQNKCKDEI